MNEVGRGRSPAEIHRASLGAGFGVGTRVLSGSDSDAPVAAVLSDPFPPVAAGGAPFRFDAFGRGAFEPAPRPVFFFAAAFFFATFREAGFVFFAVEGRDLVREDFFATPFFFFETAFRAFDLAGFFRPGAFRAGFFRAGGFLAGFFRAGALRAGFFRPGAFLAGFFRPGAFLAGFFRAGAFLAGFFRGGFLAGFFELTFLPAFDFFEAVAARRVGLLRVFRAFFLAGERFFAGFLLVAGFRLALDFAVARPPLDLRPCALDGVLRDDLRVVLADELVFRDFFAVLDRVPPELRVLPFLVAIELPAPVRRPLGSGLGAFEVPEI